MFKNKKEKKNNPFILISIFIYLLIYLQSFKNEKK